MWARGAPASGQVASGGTVTSAQVIPAWYATARTAPATAVQLSRVLAMVHAAMHDAVNGAEPRYETYASDLIDVARPPGSRGRWCGPSRALGSVSGAPGLVGCGARRVAVDDSRWAVQAPRCEARRGRRSGDPQRTRRRWMEQRGPLRSASPSLVSGDRLRRPSSRCPNRSFRT